MRPIESEVSADTPSSRPMRPSIWQLAAAQQRGTSHETSGKVCQDAYSLAMLSPELLIIAVADGAGFARYADTGASLAASHGAAHLCEHLAGDESALDEENLKHVLHGGLLAAREAVEAEASAQGASAHDFATTLILMVAKPELIAVSQIGDGATVMANQAGELIALTSPPVSEYINESTFITSAEALRTAQTTIWYGHAAQVAAFSDGLQLLCLKWPDCKPHDPFFSPLFNFIRTKSDEVQAGQELERLLKSERIRELTDDDMTLVLASVTGLADES